MSNPTGDALRAAAGVPIVAKVSPEWRAKLESVEQVILAHPQAEIATENVFHGGMYARTIRLEPDTVLSGALMRIPTLLIVNGAATLITEHGRVALDGYNVLSGAAGRKTLLVAHTAVEMTMIFPTQAKTVEDAEREFTDDYEKLMSRTSLNDRLTVTGE